MHLRSARHDQDLVRELRRRLQFWLIVLLIVAGAGVIGFHVLDRCTWLDSVYMTVCVLTTLGLSRHPATPASTMFTVVIAVCGISSFAYAASAVVRVMVSEDFQIAVERRKVRRRMQKIKDHYIICGFGRIGEIVAQQLRAQGFLFTAIERDEAVFERIEECGGLGLRGDASHEEALNEAGLAVARALIVVTASDAENVLITMTARQLNPTLPIIVRCDEECNSPKFLRAGATRVVTLNTTGANQIALAATKPYVIDLFDLATGTGKQEFEIRQLTVPAGSPVHGRSMRQLAFGSKFGVIVIGIKTAGLEMQFNPPADTAIAAGDVLITVGREEKFRELEGYLGNGKN